MKATKQAGMALTGVVIGAASIISCTKNESTTTAASTAISTISSLPKATGAVSSNSGLSVGGLAATTGTKLKDVDNSSTWSGTGKSRPMCELATMTREILREAASNDRTLCYVGKMQTLNKFSGAIDDGEYKYYTVTFGGGAQYMRVKFKIVKDATTGAITNYEMFTCNSTNGTTYTQNEYSSQTLTSTTASLVAKYVGSDSTGGLTNTFGSNVTVTGEIASDGSWTSKTVEAARTYSYDGPGSADGSFNQKLTLSQGSSAMIINGYNSASFYNAGANGGSGGTSTFSMRMYGKTELLASSAMSTIAFGDGSAKAIMTFDGQDIGGAGLGQAMTAHWTGDDRASASTSNQAAAVASATPRADDGAVTVSFTGAQTWDCSDTGSSSFSTASVSEADVATIMTCDDVYGFGSGENGGSNACFEMQ